MSAIANKLDELLKAYEGKGADIDGSLQPGLSRAELAARTEWFPIELAPELYELYAWRNGQANDPWNEEFPFWFRDMGFSSVENAKFEYESMMEHYAPHWDPAIDGIDLATVFPFAAFNGGWYVYPCSSQNLNAEHKRPIVSVFEDISVHYHSMVAMLETCIDWVKHGEYELEGGSLPEDTERKIWQRHNPGLFGKPPPDQ